MAAMVSMVSVIYGIMAESVIVSELLCYLQNYFGNVPRTILCSNVSSFYDEGEIVETKNCLFTWTNNANLGFDDVPRNKPQNPPGFNRERI